MTGNLKRLRPYDQPPRPRRSLIPGGIDSAAGLWFGAAAVWLLVAAGLGLFWISLRILPAALPGAFPDGFSFAFPIPIVNWTFTVDAETVTSGFFAALVWGWLSNAAIAAIWYITPRLTGQRLMTDTLANLALVLWNMGIAGSIVVSYIGDISSPGLLMEAPWWVDGLPLVGLTVVNLVFWRSVLTSLRGAYVSLVYLGLALISLLGFYGTAALTELPFLTFDETARSLIVAAFGRLVLVYWVTGTAVGALYYIVPRATGNPLYSSGLAWAGLVLWFALGIGSAFGALVDPSVPFAVTSLGNAATIMLVAHAFIVIANLFLSITGRWSLLLGTGTIGFAVSSLVFLGATALFDAVGALRGVQGLVGRTAWEMGAWLFLTLGAATFAWFATADHGLPRILRRDARATPLTDITLWAVLGGTTTAGLALMAGGLAEGSMSAAAAASEQIAGTLLWFDVTAGAGFGLIALGALTFVLDLFLLYTSAPRADYAFIPTTEAPTGGSSSTPSSTPSSTDTAPATGS